MDTTDGDGGRLVGSGLRVPLGPPTVGICRPGLTDTANVTVAVICMVHIGTTSFGRVGTAMAVHKAVASTLQRHALWSFELT